MDCIIEARQLFKSYGQVEAVRGIDLKIRPGICFGLLGPNGAGKSTTIEMMEGILQPSSGEILYRGKKISQKFREEVGIQFQSTALQDFLTVRNVLELFSKLYIKTARLEDLVKLCALEEFLDRDARKLSGGQRQRVLLALALVNDPDLVFLDEPTTGLDPQARRNFWSLVSGIKARGKTIVLTTHYMEEAHVLCDEIAIVDRGQVISQGTPEELLKKHFSGVWIEFSTSTALAFDHGPLKNLKSQDGFVRFQSSEVNQTLAALIQAGIALDQLKVRSPTLEDLFLDLTGRDLKS